MSMNGLGYIILISIAFGALFYLIAAKRGANTAFWAAMGVLFVQQALVPPLAVLLLVAASVFLYLAGMVLNDVYDVEIDRRERPDRPLPSGRIPVAWA